MERIKAGAHLDLQSLNNHVACFPAGPARGVGRKARGMTGRGAILQLDASLAD
jgi:hypothetical protein